VGDTGVSPSSIGLTTGLYSDGAKINIDETKLRKALTTEPEKVKSLFLETGDKFEDCGLIVRISNSLSAYTKQVSDVALDGLDKKIDDLKDEESRMETTMSDREDALWQRFSKMEEAISKMNSMQSWISSMFSGSSS
jgi:flagellar hook-associated protein 2